MEAGKSFNLFSILGSIICFFLAASVKCEVLLSEDEITFHPSKFGGSHTAGVTKYHLSVAWPSSNACDTIYGPPEYNNSHANWIVLIMGNGCKYVEQVRKAQGAGYKAALIYNPQSNVVEPMDGENTEDINISSYYIGHDDGLKLIKNYFETEEQGRTYRITVEAFEVTSEQKSELTLKQAFVFVIFPVLVICSSYFLILIVSLIFIEDYLINRQNRPVPLICLSTIPTKKFELDDPYETCAICIENYVIEDQLRLLHCSHAYHCKCIDIWLTRYQGVCPLCQRRADSP